MRRQITEIQQMKLNKLNDELRELWEALTPSEKQRRTVFNRFFDLQMQVQCLRIENNKLIEKDKNDNSSR